MTLGCDATRRVGLSRHTDLLMMLPNSSTRAILDDRLNFEVTPLGDRQCRLLNPPKSARKRPVKTNIPDKSRKKARTSHSTDETLEEDTEEEDPNSLDAKEEKSLPLSRIRRRTVFRALSSFASTSANAVNTLEGKKLWMAKFSQYLIGFLRSFYQTRPSDIRFISEKRCLYITVIAHQSFSDTALCLCLLPLYVLIPLYNQ